MSNTLLTIDMITREALRVAHEKLSFIGTIDRSYDESFAKGGAKIGDTLRVRMPAKYVRRTGSRVMDVQDALEEKQDVTAATQDGVDMKFNSAELALSLDDFSQRHIVPAVSVLVAGVEGDVLTDCTKKVYNLTGTAGTVVGASGDISALANARAKLNQFLAPKDANRAVQFDSVTMASIVNGVKTLFHDASQLKEAFREGFIARSAMADFYENEKTYNHTNGSDHTTVTVNDASLADGDSGFTTAGASVTVGTVFTIANVNAVHPETKQSYGVAQQFVITAVNGNDWTFSPTIYSTGARQNVDALPVNGAAITLHGSASTAYRQNLMYHKDFATFVTADLPLMDDASKCVRRVQDGLSLRVWQASDIRNDELLTRIDILYGWKVLRPEWACRISN